MWRIILKLQELWRQDWPEINILNFEGKWISLYYNIIFIKLHKTECWVLDIPFFSKNIAHSFVSLVSPLPSPAHPCYWQHQGNFYAIITNTHQHGEYQFLCSTKHFSLTKLVTSAWWGNVQQQKLQTFGEKQLLWIASCVWNNFFSTFD